LVADLIAIPSRGRGRLLDDLEEAGCLRQARRGRSASTAPGPSSRRASCSSPWPSRSRSSTLTRSMELPPPGRQHASLQPARLPHCLLLVMEHSCICRRKGELDAETEELVDADPRPGAAGSTLCNAGVTRELLYREAGDKRAAFDVPGTAFYTLVFSEGPPGSSLSPRGEPPEDMVTRTACSTASFGIAAAPSQRSTPPEALVTRSPSLSIRQAKLRDTFLTPTSSLMASSGMQTAM
jgi:hypothetical protein